MSLKNHFSGSFDLGELRAELARRGWSQNDLATATGLSTSYASWICRGARPTVDAVERIVAALGTEAGERIFGQSSRGEP